MGDKWHYAFIDIGFLVQCNKVIKGGSEAMRKRNQKRLKCMLCMIVFPLVLSGCAASKETPVESAATEAETSAEETVTSTPAEDEVITTSEAKGATEITEEMNEQVYALLDFEDTQELEFAQKGLIAAPESLTITDDNGKVVWSQDAYEFLDEGKEADKTVNPSLWRDTQLNHFYGLFEVMDGIYQVRGYDMTNITFVKGETGWIVFDPLMSVECSQAAMELVKSQLGDFPVKAIVISHPHIDHYGGIKGIVSEEEAAEGDIPIIVPENFEEHAISENVYAGYAMARRAGYQYGAILDQGPEGTMAMGIGMGQSKGTPSYISPNDFITETGQTRTIDGIEMEFQLTPGTEAPAEMNTYFPQKRALWMAENCTGTLHNLYTLRGAQVRDGSAWAGYIMEAITRYADKTDVVFQSHNWPHWGTELIREYMVNTASVYKYINDQTLMYINQGYTSNEIANMIELPEALEKVWYTRQYYGTVSHNSKAVYQRFMGWYDANPVNLNALEPSESAKKYVEYLGDVKEVLKKAKEDFDKGEYQWVAEITNVLVFADPKNEEARYLCADALEQLGYQAESGTWRNAYLSGAKELREGTTTDKNTKANPNQDSRKAMTSEMMLDYLSILMDSKASEDLNLTLNFVITDTQEKWLVTVNHGVILYQKDAQAENADATLKLPRQAMFTIISGDKESQEQFIEVEGSREVIEQLTQNMAEIPDFFNIVEP